MLRKYKQLVIGIIIGILIAAVPVGAAVQEYVLKQSECKIVVDGEVIKGELPLLIMEPGFNYIPAAEFRSICDKMGIGFEFDSETKEIRIDTRKTEPTIETKGVDTVSEPITQTPDGITEIDTWEGKQYIGWLYIKKKIKEKGYDFEKAEKVTTLSPIPYGTHNANWEITKNDVVVLDKIPMFFIYGHDSVEVQYYLNTILPLIQ